MADAIGDILPDRFDEPPEVSIIKDFIRKEYRQPSTVLVQPNQIVITVQSAALAGTLRMRLPELKELCRTDKRLMLRIGRR